MSEEDFIKLCIATVLALSGWGKVVYDHVMSKPKVRGRILGVMRAPSDDGKKVTFFVYAYLINSSKSSVHILDYELFVSNRKKNALKRLWGKSLRMYGRFPKDPKLTSSGGGHIKIKNINESLIAVKNAAVQYGSPLHGWVLFQADSEWCDVVELHYKLVCVDVFGVRHVVRFVDDGKNNLFLLTEIANIEFPPDMRGIEVK